MFEAKKTERKNNRVIIGKRYLAKWAANDEAVDGEGWGFWFLGKDNALTDVAFTTDTEENAKAVLAFLDQVTDGTNQDIGTHA